MTRRPAISTVAIVAATVFFAVVMFAVGVIRYRIFRAQVDLGLFTQVIASPFTGFSSTAEGGVNHLAVHFSPILFLCAPVLALTRTPLALVAIQAVASAVAVPALYLIAKRHVSKGVAICIALVTFAYPPLISMTVGDFHELAFATPVILWLIWALDARHWRSAAILAVAALAIKEDVTLIVAVLATAVSFRARRGDPALSRFCAVLAIGGTCTFVGYFALLRPALNPPELGNVPHYIHYYDWAFQGPTPAGFADLGSPQRLQYLAGALLPMILLPLVTPAFLLAVPGLVEVLASHEAITLQLSTHYVACWLPYLLFAFALGTMRVAKRSKRLAFALLGMTLAASLWIDVYASPADWWYQIYRLPNAHDAAVERTLHQVPRDASVGSDLWIFAHLGLHPRATIDPKDAQFVVVDRQCDTPYCHERIFPIVAARVAAHQLQLAHADLGVELYAAVKPTPAARAPR